MMIWMFLAGLAAQPQAQSPKAWVEHVYAEYRDNDFSPFKHADRYFSPHLLAAIREDERLAKGEVGYLDADPLCDCQDWAKLTARVRSLSQPTKSSAVAMLHVDYGTGETRDLKLKLVLTPKGWRVEDVGSKDEPSLLAALQKANREARASH
jgi:hypothetical protein